MSNEEKVVKKTYFQQQNIEFSFDRIVLKDLDGLNYLEGKTLDFVDEKAYLGTLAAHVDGGVPVVTMDMGELNDTKLGEMFYFLELSCGVSAYMLGVNPFNQPGVEFYKRNMFQRLGKPGYEAK